MTSVPSLSHAECRPIERRTLFTKLVGVIIAIASFAATYFALCCSGLQNCAFCIESFYIGGLTGVLFLGTGNGIDPPFNRDMPPSPRAERAAYVQSAFSTAFCIGSLFYAPTCFQSLASFVLGIKTTHTAYHLVSEVLV
ncbi:MAG: hypothetical protein HY861_03980 [Chlamydiia bacterium]|nr:hypothetical protein [Chlamydiia bacterium]